MHPVQETSLLIQAARVSTGSAGHTPQLQVPPLARPRFEPSTGDYWSTPFVAYRARTCRRLQEFARRSGTGVHDRHRLAVRRESRPRFAGVGCGVLSLPRACHAGGPRSTCSGTPPRPSASASGLESLGITHSLASATLPRVSTPSPCSATGSLTRTRSRTPVADRWGSPSGLLSAGLKPGLKPCPTCVM